MTRIALVRHGQTDWNLAGRIQGSTDIVLNQTGRDQAVLASELLQDLGIQWGGVLCSPLQRAAETAQIIAEQLDLPTPEQDPRLQERNYGQVEGMYAEERAKLINTPEHELGIESRESVCARALEALLGDVHGRDLIVVTHGGVISSILRYLSDGAIPEPGRFISNGSHQLLRLADGVLEIDTVNMVDDPRLPSII